MADGTIHVTIASAPVPPIAGAGRSKPTLLAGVLLYGASRGLTEVLLALRGLALATILGPTGFGGWTLFRISLRYMTFAGLGIFRGLEREVVRTVRNPGSAEPVPGEIAARTTLGFVLLVFGVLGAASLVASFLVRSPMLAMTLRVLGIVGVTEHVVVYALVYLRARGGLRRFAMIEMAQAALHLVLASLFALRWGLAGALVGFTLASLGSVALMLRRAPARPVLDRASLRALLRIGFPLVLALLTATTLATADRLVVAAYGGTTLLGYYAFALAVAGLAGSFALVVRTVVFPEVYSRADSAGAANAIRNYLDRVLMPFARLYPPLLGACALLIGPVVDLLVPQYTQAIAPARLFIFKGVTTGFAGLGALGIVAAERQRLLPYLSGGALVVNVGLSYLALRVGFGLEGVALGTLLSQAAYGAAIVALAVSAAELDRPVRVVVRTQAPLLYCAGLVFALRWLLPGTDLRSTLVAAGLYTVSLAPLVPALAPELARLRRAGAGRAMRASSAGGTGAS